MDKLIHGSVGNELMHKRGCWKGGQDIHCSVVESVDNLAQRRHRESGQGNARRR